MTKDYTPPSYKTLLSLASKQIWPHILSVAYLKPKRLILLHSNAVDESKRPTQSSLNVKAGHKKRWAWYRRGGSISMQPRRVSVHGVRQWRLVRPSDSVA